MAGEKDVQRKQHLRWYWKRISIHGCHLKLLVSKWCIKEWQKRKATRRLHMWKLYRHQARSMSLQVFLHTIQKWCTHFRVKVVRCNTFPSQSKAYATLATLCCSFWHLPRSAFQHWHLFQDRSARSLDLPLQLQAPAHPLPSTEC